MSGDNGRLFGCDRCTVPAETHRIGAELRVMRRDLTNMVTEFRELMAACRDNNVHMGHELARFTTQFGEQLSRLATAIDRVERAMS